jgi:hypothetical protein
MGAIGVPELLIIAVFVCMAMVVIWPVARICSRLGFSPWLAILVLVPIGNLFLLWFIALSPWPALPSDQPGVQRQP